MIFSFKRFLKSIGGDGSGGRKEENYALRQIKNLKRGSIRRGYFLLFFPIIYNTSHFYLSPSMLGDKT